LVEAADGLPGRTHEEPIAGAAALERIEDLVSDRFGLVDEQSGWRLGLIVEPFNVA
jgi:hypothetical protein